MNNFGVVELAGGKTTRAPGWAYVPDVGPSPAQALQPTNRKGRAARNQAGPSAADVSARQDAKIRKELEALDRDTNKDVNIPIPPKPGGSRAQASNKHTPNVRKILQSQKTFTNYVDDYQALLALAETNPAAAAALNPASAAPPKTAPPSTARSSPAPPLPEPKSTAASKRSAAAAKRAAAKEAKEAEEAAAAKAKAEAKSKAPEPPVESKDEDIEMTDAPVDVPTQPAHTTPGTVPPALNQLPQSYPPDGAILPAYQKPPPPTHPSDNDPLLVSRVPPFPTDEELRSLVTAPPLSYLEARATWGDEETRYPTRVFCEVCGYWGRVRCLKCGARVCALDCLEMHKVECVTRYGL
ncbi:hypothetical protein QBC34DRAFT_409212 [Podospora aff. communis PSN243]|uniref:HIT-type domain-containing protein n=1 Tax=Podospora aff. communis PSN243 TaxID=3040156 RepID=A0AAV9GHS8_9PEZI|nr:hypothetical protein QBC34DRAFT_409212 [Podospora aff. communis PSN243]